MSHHKKRILIISTEFPPVPGGIGTHAYFLANELHLLGWQVEVFTERFEPYEKEVKEFERNCKFPIYRAEPTPSVPSLVGKILKLFFTIIRFSPNVIIGTGKHAVWFCSFISKLTFRKSVAIGHGTEFTIVMSDFSKRMNRWAYSATDAIIFVSDFTKRMAEKTGITNRSSFTIYNGADGSFFRTLSEETITNFKKQKGIEAARLLVTVGNVTDRKGQEYVLRALPLIRRTIPNIHYYCLGHQTITDKLQYIANDLAIAEHVHFPGKVSSQELLLWLNSCDIYCLTSVITDTGDFEGFGISVIEAALCAKPAIVTADAGVSESVIHTVTGLHVPPKNPDAIADAVIKLLNDNELRMRLGRQALENARQKLTWDKVVKQYEQILLNL